MKTKKPNVQKTRPWQPMQRGEINPAYLAHVYPEGFPPGTSVEVWGNDLYQATVEHHESGMSYISFKRHDRAAARDWRHFQAIKNEVCDPEREAIELFPRESRLMDTSNQYHLWVFPLGEDIPLGQFQREIVTAEDIQAFNREHGGKARQRAWQPGLPTGANLGGDTGIGDYPSNGRSGHVL